MARTAVEIIIAKTVDQEKKMSRAFPNDFGVLATHLSILFVCALFVMKTSIIFNQVRAQNYFHPGEPEGNCVCVCACVYECV